MDTSVNNQYDCTQDVLEHRRAVARVVVLFFDILTERSRLHDESKLQSPEKEMFDEFTPKIKQLRFGGDAYIGALEQMGEALKHHYELNPHHPEHFNNGISGMTLWDLVEMFADWRAAANAKNSEINFDYLQNRFSVDRQIIDILKNTVNQMNI